MDGFILYFKFLFLRKLNCLLYSSTSTTKFYFSIDSPFISKQELISLLPF